MKFVRKRIESVKAEWTKKKAKVIILTYCENSGLDRFKATASSACLVKPAWKQQQWMELSLEA
jgi:hypothetical protein